MPTTNKVTVDMKTEVQKPAYDLHVMFDGSSVFFDPEGHVYRIVNEKGKPGLRVPGVSTVASAFPDRPDGLMYWTESITLESIGLLISEQEHKRAEGYIHPLPTTSDALRDLLHSQELRYCNVRDKAAKRGTAIHEQILEALATGKEVPDLECLEPEERGYGQAVMKFWLDKDPEVLQAEQITYSELYKCAGKFDLRAWIDGEVWLIDAKTSNKIRCREHVQIEGYEALNQACGLGCSDRRILLHLSPDGTYELHESQATEDDFMLALNAYESKKRLDKALYAAEKERVKNV